MFLYALALGSNRPRGRGRRPAELIAAAVTALGAHGRVTARSPTIETPAIGPAGRRFANAALLIETTLAPSELLTALKAIERAAGRRRGRRWGARTLDIDILLWSGGRWRSRRPALVIPHVALAERAFVLTPLAAIAPGWRVPGTALAIRQLAARLTRRALAHNSRPRSGP